MKAAEEDEHRLRRREECSKGHEEKRDEEERSCGRKRERGREEKVWGARGKQRNTLSFTLTSLGSRRPRAPYSICLFNLVGLPCLFTLLFRLGANSV